MKNINWKLIVTALSTLVVGLLLGWILFGNRHEESSREQAEAFHQHDEVWTCSMHPQIRKNEPGKCPICGMDLIKLNDGSSATSSNIVMREDAIKLANIQTTIVGNRQSAREIRLNGKVKPDERKVVSQVAHVPGRIETLSVNFTGEYVRRGQTLATLYSPELVTAQQEVLQAYKIRAGQPELYRAAREKLKNWKLTEKAIDNIISSRASYDKFSVLADVSGIVTEKRVNLGDYVERGKPLYEIADLSTVWVLFEVYESDLAWVKVGDDISFTVPSLPGEMFEGKVVFVDPILNPTTRVATARVEVPNQKGVLKPEMFVNGVMRSQTKNDTRNITVPKTAVLWTGERSIVYVKHIENGEQTFELREVTLGPAVGDAYVISKGLENGQEVVTNGVFAVDATSQLAGKESMMSHGGMGRVDVSSHQFDQVKKLIAFYLGVKNALVNDDFALVKAELKKMEKHLSIIKISDFSEEDHAEWMKHASELKSTLDRSMTSSSIKEVRDHFTDLSGLVIGLAEYFGPFDDTLYVLHCPMADSNKGADWLSKESEVRNPYFGSAMLTCGEVRREVVRSK